MTEIILKSDIDVELIQHVGGDHMVVAAAKVSTNDREAKEFADPAKAEENKGLINYLMKHRHGTPFEHGSMTFFVHAPIFVWREWHRHRIGWSYNEVSGRYTQLKPIFYIADEQRPLIKAANFKPARPMFEPNTVDLMSGVNGNLIKSYQLAYEEYEKGLALNIDPGVARACLPVGIYSSCWCTCNARSLMSFLSLRTYNENAKFLSYPLKEIQMAADKCESIFAELYPITYKAFCDNGRIAP